ncbi:hypothetical protein AX17_001638 [Amanita inopinata Kibby_2008]|nr:hypothetical protein AX17_001638 [Amanita inopinata Kibby_2008]
MPVEQLRKRFAEDLNLYPALALGGYRDKNAKQSKESPSVISIASSSAAGSRNGESISVASTASSVSLATDSLHERQGDISSTSTSSTPPSVIPGPTKHKVRPPVISSSSEDDDPEVENGLFQKNKFPEAEIPPVAKRPNEYLPYERPEQPPYKLPANPIHIPSNRDLPRPIQTGAVPGPSMFPEPVMHMTSGEADKAVKDLMAGSINEDIVADIAEEDLIVPGFKEGIELLPHQALGRIWMKERETGKKMGGILADDMGLGKTIQTLTRIVEGRARKSDASEGWSPSTLVICPLALVGQWADEIRKMTSGYTVKTHHGTSRTADPANLKAHVVITTYDVVKSEYDAYQTSALGESQLKDSKKKQKGDDSSDEDDGEVASKTKPKTTRGAKKAALFRIKWWRVVLDEAHNIKNERTKGALACSALRAKYRWCLTGTPMQNNVQELYSLFKFLRIKPLNDWTSFNEQIAKPVKTGKDAGRAMKKLRAVLQEVMLRRTKDQTLNGKRLVELPKRDVNVISCPFDSVEQAFYNALETKMDATLEKLMASKSGNSAYISVLLLLLRLRQACNHPILVTKDFKKDAEAVEPKAVKKGASDKDGDGDDLIAAFGQLGVSRKCQFCTTELNPSNTAEGKQNNYCIDCEPLARKAEEAERERPSSAKIRKILEILRDIGDRSEGEKTIIFSQFTSMLDLIEPFLKDEGIRYVRYDGSMKAADREAALARIKDDGKTRVILISFKAGSTGLNLTVCNNVILVDLWWNPALEDQAFDRAHRFGQTRDVNIFKLKIDNTVEDRILELQERKRALTRAALSGAKVKDMHLGFEELLGLLKYGRDEDEDESD